MRKFKLAIAAWALTIVPFIAVDSVAAAGTCQAGFSGPDSNNLCTATVTYTCTVVNDNTVQIDNTNTQIAVSGNASSGGGAGSGASSGSATNSNGVTFTATVTNNDVCMVTATTPATPVAPGSSARSRDAVVKPLAKEETPPAVLAETSGDMTPQIIAVVLAIGVVGIASIRIAMTVLARKHS